MHKVYTHRGSVSATSSLIGFSSFCGREIIWLLSETVGGPCVTVGDSNCTFQDKVNKPKGFAELPLWKKLQIKTPVEKWWKFHIVSRCAASFLHSFWNIKKIHCFCFSKKVWWNPFLNFFFHLQLFQSDLPLSEWPFHCDSKRVKVSMPRLSMARCSSKPQRM